MVGGLDASLALMPRTLAGGGMKVIGRPLALDSSDAWKVTLPAGKPHAPGVPGEVSGTTSAAEADEVVGCDGLSEQTREVLRCGAAALEEVGAGLEHVVRTARR